MADVTKADKQATWSMILGLSSFLCTCMTGIPALILGALAISDASAKGKFRAKVGMGSGGLMTAVIFAYSIFANPGANTPPRSTSSTSSAATPPKEASEVSRPAKPPEAPKPAYEVEVDAVNLWNAYDANEVAADAKYKGKKLLVTGRVQSIDKDFLDNVVLQLSSPNEFMPTHATLKDSEISAAGTLQKGNRVRMICTGKGRIVGSPSLDACVFHRE